MAQNHTESLKTINSIIKDAKIAMLTTVNSEGELLARPMDTQEAEFDGDVWFFSEAGAGKVRDVRGNSNVNVSYNVGNRYVSLVGRASIVTDVNKKRELWKPDLKAWFENGPEDPNVVLIHIDGQSAEFWDGPPGGAIGGAIAAVTVLLTGNEEAYGSNEKVTLP